MKLFTESRSNGNRRVETRDSVGGIIARKDKGQRQRQPTRGHAGISERHKKNEHEVTTCSDFFSVNQVVGSHVQRSGRRADGSY